MSSPVWQITSSELPNRRTSPNSAQIATAVTALMPNWVARRCTADFAHDGCLPSARPPGSMSALGPGGLRRPATSGAARCPS